MSRRGEDPPTPSSSKGKLPAVPPRITQGSSSRQQWQFGHKHGLTPVSVNPVTEATPAVTTPIHISPTFTTYRLQNPSSLESARSPVQPEGVLSEEDYPIPTVQEEEMAEGLSAAMSAGMSLQDPFGASNPTRSELEEWYKRQFLKEVVAPPVAPRPR